MSDISLGPFNTLAISAGTVYRLRGATGASGSNRPLDLLNIGPGTIYLRADLDPTLSDPYSLQLPAGWAVNDLITDGLIGLGVIADANTKISVKVT